MMTRVNQYQKKTFTCTHLSVYVCMTIYVRAAAYSLNCHVGAMISRMLYRTFQSLVMHRTMWLLATPLTSKVIFFVFNNIKILCKVIFEYLQP